MEKIAEAFALILAMDKELLQILAVTFRMSFFSTLISCCIGLPLGVIIEKGHFVGRKLIKKIASTLMGLPPVVAGLIVYMLFTRYGIFGELKLLYTVEVMVIAQVLLITPVVISLTCSITGVSGRQLSETVKGLSLSRTRTLLLFLKQYRRALIGVVLTAFGRSIAEVGAVSLVGGNIQWKTRVMTTAIMLETSKGKLSLALALGIILIVISFSVNLVIPLLTGGGEKND